MSLMSINFCQRFILTSLFILNLFSSEIQSDVVCPENCDENLVVDGFSGCKPDEIVQEKAICDCFPVCVPKKGFGEMCELPATEDSPDECGPGLKCTEQKLDEETVILTCDADRKDCRHYQYITPENGYLHKVLWKPECGSDGTYSSVQCKGEKLTGRCYCYSPDGLRLFGEQWWRHADDMNCACSRKVNQLKQAGRNDVTIHCSPDGNFEPLQCDSGFCWCVDPKTGDYTSMVVLQEQMKYLQCYSSLKIGSQYLRKCESERYAAVNILNELKMHGTENFMINMSICDPDGSYGRYQFFQDKIICTWIDKTKISNYQAQHDQSKPESNKLDCNCARDSMIYTNITKLESCGGSGNYNELQFINDLLYCIDSDGFPISQVHDKEVNCQNYIYEKNEF